MQLGDEPTPQPQVKPVTETPTKIKAPAEAPTWDSLNEATQVLFFSLCEAIIEHTKDASLVIGARLGHDIPKISHQDAPRLTNLKKVGVLETVQGEKASFRMLQVTPAGRQRYHAAA